MAKITDSDNLTQGTEVVIDTANKTVQLLKAGNLSDDGVTLQALYSFLKEEWLNDGTLIPYDFPLEAITPEQFEFIQDWEPKDILSVNLLRDAGFLTRAAAGTVKSEYMGFDSVFPLDDNAQSSGDQVYVELNAPNGTTADMYITGQANQPIKIYGDATHGNFDYRSNNLRFFVREQGKKYGGSSVSALNVPLPLTYKKYAFPISNGSDLKITASDATITTSAPYTAMGITVGTVSRTIGASSYNFDIVIDGNDGTAEQIYEFVQYQLRQSGDIDGGAGTLNGKTADDLLQFVGDTLITADGVYIDNFNSNDTNRITFTDNTGTARNFPFVAAGSLSFNANLQNDASAKYWVFFSSGFGSGSSIIVNNNSDVPLTGLIGGNAALSFDFDYDGNAQGGRTPATDAAVTIVAVGLNTGKYVQAQATITRAVGQNISLVAGLERNYTNA